jgi:hypothetical protein
MICLQKQTVGIMYLVEIEMYTKGSQDQRTNKLTRQGVVGF